MTIEKDQLESVIKVYTKKGYEQAISDKTLVNREDFIAWVEKFNWTEEETRIFGIFKEMLRGFGTDKERAELEAKYAQECFDEESN